MAQTPRAENNWRGGNNRGGWASPDYDRVLQGFTATLEPSARSAQLAELARIFTDDLPMISLLFQGNPYAHIAALHGPAVTAPESAVAWNVHEWIWAD
jgi:ABC-type oligopeptide transport system substrate-binding subunit